MFTAAQFKKDKESLSSGFVIFYDYYRLMVKYNKREKTLYILYRDISYAGPCSTAKSAIDRAVHLINSWAENK